MGETQENTDLFPAGGQLANLPELSVSDIARTIRKAVEGTGDPVRVRGEVSGFRQHGSGHLYFRLKDQHAVLEAVCWRHTARRLRVRPEEGAEVVCTGRITTWPAGSRYQILCEDIAPAGRGALMAILEERRKRLASEGLFDRERKRPVPPFPAVIGVITSPDGAVIRDILHRLSDRFPCHVLVWGTAVQGREAPQQIAAAISGFNRIPPGNISPPRPDVLIVARGGGSVEDLWAFNEEVVVRAVHASTIPLVSAVGHETDTTLVDHAADLRAPTPTAAAEMTTPDRHAIFLQLQTCGTRLLTLIAAGIDTRRERLALLARGLPDARRLLQDATRRLDDLCERLDHGFRNGLGLRESHLAGQTGGRRLERALALATARRSEALIAVTARLSPALPARRLLSCEEGLSAAGRLLESLSWRSVLERGFAVVRDRATGSPVRMAAALRTGQALELEFPDGRREAKVTGRKADTSGGGGKADTSGGGGLLTPP